MISVPGRALRPLPVALAALLSAPPAGLAAAQESLIVDAGSTHLYRGFGVNLFVPSPHRDARDALLRDLRIRFVRVSVFHRLADEQLSGQPSVAELAARIAADQDAAELARLAQFRDEMRRLDIDIHLVFRKLPEPWSISTGTRNGRDQRRVDPAHIGDFARWIPAQLVVAGRSGIVPKAIELMGEPDGPWNTQFTPDQYDALVAQTRAAMDATGLRGIGIEGPGTSEVGAARPYLEALIRSGHLRLLADVSVHDYDSRARPDPSGLAPLPPALRRGLDGQPLFVTEFSDNSPRWNQPPFDASPLQQGGSRPASMSPDYGVAIAA